jgi:hypothetical protein
MTPRSLFAAGLFDTLSVSFWGSIVEVSGLLTDGADGILVSSSGWTIAETED